jgi:hypothetical protein
MPAVARINIALEAPFRLTARRDCNPLLLTLNELLTLPPVFRTRTIIFLSVAWQQQGTPDLMRLPPQEILSAAQLT